MPLRFTQHMAWCFLVALLTTWSKRMWKRHAFMSPSRHVSARLLWFECLQTDKDMFATTTQAFCGFTHSTWTQPDCIRVRAFLRPASLHLTASLPLSLLLLLLSFSPAKHRRTPFSLKTGNKHGSTAGAGLTPPPVRIIHGPFLDVRLTGGYVKTVIFSLSRWLLSLETRVWIFERFVECRAVMFQRWVSCLLSHSSPMVAVLCDTVPLIAAVKMPLFNLQLF